MSVLEMPLGPELRIDPERVLAAAQGEYVHVVVIGLKADGEVVTASSPRLSETAAMIEYARRDMNYRLLQELVGDEG